MFRGWQEVFKRRRAGTIDIEAIFDSLRGVRWCGTLEQIDAFVLGPLRPVDGEVRHESGSAVVAVVECVQEDRDGDREFERVVHGGDGVRAEKEPDLAE